MRSPQILAMTPQGLLYLKRYKMHLRGICDHPHLPDYAKLSGQEARRLLGVFIEGEERRNRSEGGNPDD